MKLKTLCSVAAMTVAGVELASAGNDVRILPDMYGQERVYRQGLDGMFRQTDENPLAFMNQNNTNFAANNFGMTRDNARPVMSTFAAPNMTADSFNVEAWKADILTGTRTGQTVFWDPQNKDTDKENKIPLQSFQFRKPLTVYGLGGVDERGQPNTRAALGNGDVFIIPKNNAVLNSLKTKLDKPTLTREDLTDDEFYLISALARGVRMQEEQAKRFAEAHEFLKGNQELQKAYPQALGAMEAALKKDATKPAFLANYFEGADFNANVTPYGSQFSGPQVNYFDNPNDSSQNSAQDGDVANHELGHLKQLIYRDDIFMAMTPASRGLLEGEADLGSFLTLVNDLELTKYMADWRWVYRSGEALAKELQLPGGFVRDLDSNNKLSWDHQRGATGHEEHGAGQGYVAVYWDTFKAALEAMTGKKAGPNNDSVYSADEIYKVGHVFGITQALALIMQPEATMSSNIRMFDTILGVSLKGIGFNDEQIKQTRMNMSHIAAQNGFGIGNSRGVDETDRRWTQPLRPQFMQASFTASEVDKENVNEHNRHVQHWDKMYAGFVKRQQNSSLSFDAPQSTGDTYPTYRFPGTPDGFTFPKTLDDLLNGGKGAVTGGGSSSSTRPAPQQQGQPRLPQGWTQVDQGHLKSPDGRIFEKKGDKWVQVGAGQSQAPQPAPTPSQGGAQAPTSGGWISGQHIQSSQGKLGTVQPDGMHALMDDGTVVLLPSAPQAPQAGSQTPHTGAPGIPQIHLPDGWAQLADGSVQLPDGRIGDMQADGRIVIRSASGTPSQDQHEPFPTPRPSLSGNPGGVVETLPDGRVRLADGRIGELGRDGRIGHLRHPRNPEPAHGHIHGHSFAPIAQITDLGNGLYQLDGPQGRQYGHKNRRGEVVFNQQDAPGFVVTAALVFAVVEGIWTLIKGAYDLYQHHQHPDAAAPLPVPQSGVRGSHVASDDENSDDEDHYGSHRHHHHGSMTHRGFADRKLVPVHRTYSAGYPVSSYGVSMSSFGNVERPVTRTFTSLEMPALGYNASVSAAYSPRFSTLGAFSSPSPAFGTGIVSYGSNPYGHFYY